MYMKTFTSSQERISVSDIELLCFMATFLFDFSVRDLISSILNMKCMQRKERISIAFAGLNSIRYRD